jgi:XTP/dITP diphosphohydrolase
MDERLIAFKRLLDIMDDLREKCPWDKKQTFESLRHLTIEETYELADAILDNDLKEVEGEIGDLFLHMVFYSKLGSETGVFDVSSVLNRICDKLIYRHPHIYADTQAETEEEVKANWEKLKLKEGKKSVLEGVPKSLPAMVKASRIQEKVKGVGFDWEQSEQVWEKVQDEFGDVLFSMINYARFLNINPENALEKTNKKFIARFQKMEEISIQNNQSISELNFQELDTYWNQAKELLKS